jgi:lysophospholipase L1-like esterase
MQPNVITINAGVNDMHENLDIKNAANRMDKLLDEAFDKIEGVTILLSTLLPTTKQPNKDNIKTYNPDLRNLIQYRQQTKKQKIVLAEMDDGRIDPVKDLAEGVHPNDKGYKIMGDIWWEAFQEAEKLGFITRPNNVGMSDGPSIRLV